MTFANYVGIDPGITGAIARLDHENELTVEDMPEEIEDLAEAVFKIQCDVMNGSVATKVYLEKAQPMRAGPAAAKQGVASTAKYMKNYGILLGMITYAEIPVIEVTASAWKRKMKCTAEKEQSLVRCLEIFGEEYRDLWFGPKMGLLDGRCEAALLAAYGRDHG